MIDVETVEVTELAAKVLIRVGRHLEQLRYSFGADSPFYLSAVESWANVQARTWELLSTQGGRLISDNIGDGHGKSLGISCTNGFYVGLIWFRNRDFDHAQLKREDLAPDSDPWVARWCRMHNTAMDTNHEASPECFATVVPIPGEWSMHS
jgi:hypothetical protein